MMQDYKVLHAKNAQHQLMVRVLFNEEQPVSVLDHMEGFAYPILGHSSKLGLLTIRNPKGGGLYSVFYRQEGLVE